MELALIAPTSVLDLYATSTVTMCLAHQVLQDPIYAEHYRDLSMKLRVRTKRLQGTVIMDNSLWELGNPMTIEDLQKACEVVRPTELIVPDAFRDGPKTVELLTKFLDAIGTVLDGLPWRRNLAVAHGKDREEWLECFDTLNEHAYVHTVGLPKVLDDIWTPGGRVGCLMFLEASRRIHTDAHKEYHCLGLWDDPIEVLLLSRFSWLRSLDTALPIHAGLQATRFHPELGLSRRRTRRPSTYFDLPRERIMVCVKDINHNVNLLKRWARGGIQHG